MRTHFCLLIVGPFVMTSDKEIEEARQDYRLGRNGFENAHKWNSFVVYEDDDPGSLT